MSATAIKVNSTPFIKQETRGIPKTVRLNSIQRDILDCVAELEESNTTDVILRALDMYACAVLKRTSNPKLRRLLTS